MDVFALDFDGVICDTAGEAAVSAWKAARALWPGLPEADPDDAWVERLRRLRPVLETGYEAVILARLIQGGVSDREILARFRELCASLLAEEGRSSAPLTRLFGHTRDQWIAHDPVGWLARQRFYPGVLEAVQTTLAESPVFILTTKQERFVKVLLGSRGLVLPEGAIFGLERGKLKEDVLRDLKRRPEFLGARLHFVEDRLATLERVAKCTDLGDVRLYLAGWGYNTPEERLRASGMPRVTIWNLDRFLKV
jgi:phosphoglycolate phosphatase-like HAD superfamily hydrolase